MNITRVKGIIQNFPSFFSSVDDDDDDNDNNDDNNNNNNGKGNGHPASGRGGPRGSG